MENREQMKLPEDLIWQRIGLPVTMRQYGRLRYGFIAALLMIAIVTWVRGNHIAALYWFLIDCLAGILSYPAPRLWNYQTGFYWMLEKLRHGYLDRKNDELMVIIVQMKNIIIAQQQEPRGTDFILESVMRFARLTKPIFEETISLLRLNRLDEAYTYFSEAFGTRLGMQFAAIIIKMDELPPAEFLPQLDLFQERVLTMQITRRRKKQQTQSTVMTALAMILVLLALMNFIAMIMWASFQDVLI